MNYLRSAGHLDHGDGEQQVRRPVIKAVLVLEVTVYSGRIEAAVLNAL